MFILDGLSRFAGRALSMNADVFASAAESNSRNQAIGQLLQSCGRLPIETQDAIDLYTRQCSLNVTAKDLGVMGATLADGGVNPLTKQRVIDAESCKFTLAVMATAGLYETSGDWLYEVGLPGKSGIGGGIVTVSPARADSAHSLRGSTTPATASRDSWPRNTFRSASASACLLRRRQREVRERLSDQALPADLSR